VNTSLSRLITPRGVTDPADISRARLTLFFASLFATTSLMAALFSAINSTVPAALATFFFALFFASVNGAAVLVSQTRRWRFAAVLVTFYLMGVGTITISTSFQTSLILFTAVPLIYIGIIYGPRGVALAGVVLGIAAALGIVMRNRGVTFFNPPQILLNENFDLVIVVLILAALVFVISLQQNEERGLREYARRLFAQLRATAEVAQTTSTILELDDLLRRTVDYIRDRFGFYHVQIFLIDEDRRYADLVASTGEVGQELLKRGHRLAVGSQSIIGRVTLTGEPTIAADTEADPLHRRNELLTDTRSELALPLIVGNDVIGALDVQSTRANAYSQEDIDSLSIMATQISIAIRNAQLFEEQRRALNENRRLFLEAETNLREIERLNQRLTGGAWEQYLAERKASVFGVTLQNNDLRYDSTWTPGLTQAIERRRPVVTTRENRHLIAVPVELRGEILGAIEIEMTENLRQADLLEMVQAVAGRLALNIDNARLFEEAQQAAQQELQVNAITTRMQGVTDVDDLLRTVVAELGRTFSARQASIRRGVGAPQVSNASSSNGKASHD
jgi:GAF domain-containing protein